MIISSLIGAVIAVRHTETFPEWQTLSAPETAVGIISINGINFALSKNRNLYVCPTILEEQECKNSPYPGDVPLIEEQMVTNTQKSLDCTSIQYLLDGFVHTYDTDVVACAITMNSAEQQSIGVAFVLDEAGEIWRWSPLRDGSISTATRGAIVGGIVGLILLTFYIAIRSISKRLPTRVTVQFQ